MAQTPVVVREHAGDVLKCDGKNGLATEAAGEAVEGLFVDMRVRGVGRVFRGLHKAVSSRGPVRR